MSEHTVITSPSAKKLKHIAALLKKSRTRRDEGCFVAEGRHLFDELADDDLREIYVSKTYYGKCSAAVDTRNKPVCIVDDALFAKISDTKTPQGILCVAHMREAKVETIIGSDSGADESDAGAGFEGAVEAGASSAKAGAPLVLVVDQISDPGNLGTMIRTAEASGVTGVVLTPGCADVYQPKVVRAAMGALFRMPVLTLENDAQTQDLLRRFKERGISLYATDLAADAAYDQVDYSGPCAIVIGNESHGVSAGLLTACDRRIIIPMQGQIESLNAAIAASLVTFEAARQRRSM